MAEAPPQLSPDGRFYWDGTRWIPTDSGQGYTPQPTVAYGGLLIRFVAYLIDSLIIGIPAGIAFFVLAISGVLGSSVSTSDLPSPPPGGTAYGAITLNPPAIILFWLAVLIVAGAYYSYFWGTSGSTLGMRIFRLRVVDANSGQRIGVGRGVIRYIGLIVAALPCWIGLIWAAFDSRAQGWNDKIASTVVLQG